MITALLLAAIVVLTPAETRRANAIADDIRCVVCQNQSINESEAELAAVMRRLIAERIAEGDSDEEVVQYLTDRYGEAVLLKPTASPKNLVLWAGPAIALAAGAVWVFFLFRRSAKS